MKQSTAHSLQFVVVCFVGVLLAIHKKNCLDRWSGPCRLVYLVISLECYFFFRFSLFSSAITGQANGSCAWRTGKKTL